MKKFYFAIPRNVMSFKYFKDVWFNPIFLLSGKSIFSDDFTLMTSTSKFVKSNRLEIVYSPKKKNCNWFVIGIY